MKIKVWILLPCMFLFLQNLCAQKRKIEPSRNNDKSVSFTYSSDVPGSVFVMMKFSRLTNTSSGVVKTTVSGYSGHLTTLYPSDTKKSIGFSYRTRTFPGNIRKKADHNFTYILPVKRGKEIKVRNLSYLGKRFGNKAPENWKSFQFLTSLNDTIFAIRKGIVINVVDKYEQDTIKEYNFKSQSNSITIEHNDGTFANYKVLKKNSMFVNVGDIVYPSAPIAIAGSYDKDENSQLRLSIYYLNKKVKDLDFDKIGKTKISEQIHIYSYVDPFFYVDDQIKPIQLEPFKTYVSNYKDEIIPLEMTRRERKKWKKKGLLVKKSKFF